jgi:hypothetical protein
MIFISLPREGWGGVDKNIPHEGVFRDGRIVEIYKNKMVSERSEFHFVISTISSSAPEPGRFLLFLLFLFFYGNKEKRMTILVPLQKRTSPPWGG